MAQNIAGGLEHLLEDLVRRAVRDAIAEAGISGVGTASSSAPAAAPSASSSASSSLPLVNRAVSRVLQPTGQSEIMAAVLQSASGFAGRCALFVRRGEGFSFWRGEGFAAETVSDLKSLSAPARQPGAFKEAAENLVGVSTVRNAEALPSAMVSALAGAADDALYLFPIVVQGRAVAALYADSGSNAGSVESSALEILTRVTGLSLETAAGRAAASAAHPVMAPAESSAPAEAPASDALQFLTIDIHRKSFEPPSATAGQGTKLVLTNRDTISHPVYIRFEDEVFLATKIIKPEASLTVILDRAGIYKLFESTYGLKGRIDVQKSLVIVPGKVD